MAKKKSFNGLLIGGVVFFAFLIIGGLVAIIFVLQYFADTNPPQESGNINVNQIASENEVIDFDYPEFKTSKVIKSSEDVDTKIEYEIRESDPQGMFKASIRDDKVYIQKDNTNGLFDETFKESKIDENQIYEVGNIDKKVIDVHIGYCGNGIGNPILLILTEDGNLRHVKLLEAVNTATFTASDPILKKVVRIEDVNVNKNNVNMNSIIIITEDGNLYDIASII